MIPVGLALAAMAVMYFLGYRHGIWAGNARYAKLVALADALIDQITLLTADEHENTGEKS